MKIPEYGFIYNKNRKKMRLILVKKSERPKKQGALFVQNFRSQKNESG